MNDPLAPTVNLLAALAYVGLIVAIALRQLDRIMRHRLMRSEAPELLIRDAVFFWALVILIGLPSIAGAFGVVLGDFLWWVIVRSAIGVGVLLVWAWFEFFFIGARRSK